MPRSFGNSPLPRAEPRPASPLPPMLVLYPRPWLLDSTPSRSRSAMTSSSDRFDLRPPPLASPAANTRTHRQSQYSGFGIHVSGDNKLLGRGCGSFSPYEISALEHESGAFMYPQPTPECTMGLTLSPCEPVLDLLDSVLHRAGSPPSSSVVHSEPPSGTPSRRLPLGLRLCLKLDQLLKTAVGGGAGSLGGVTGKLNASGPPVPLSFGVTGSCSL